MQRYSKGKHDTGVAAYEAGTDFIRVKFNDGGIYLYTYNSAGWRHIEMMKLLAPRGKGLNTYINKYVRGRYERKEA